MHVTSDMTKSGINCCFAEKRSAAPTHYIPLQGLNNVHKCFKSTCFLKTLRVWAVLHSVAKITHSTFKLTDNPKVQNVAVPYMSTRFFHSHWGKWFFFLFKIIWHLICILFVCFLDQMNPWLDLTKHTFCPAQFPFFYNVVELDGVNNKAMPFQASF